MEEGNTLKLNVGCSYPKGYESNTWTNFDIIKGEGVDLVG